VLLGMVLSAAHAGGSEEIPITGMKGFPQDNNRVSGLALQVEDAGWPLLGMLDGRGSTLYSGLFGTFRGPKQGGGVAPVAMQFGCVSAGQGGSLTGQNASEVTNTLTYSCVKGSVKVTVTRLSPAVLLESDAGEIELFSLQEKPVSACSDETLPPAPGAVKPLRWAAPGSQGRVLTGVLGTQPDPGLPKVGYGMDEGMRAGSRAREIE